MISPLFPLLLIAADAPPRPPVLVERAQFECLVRHVDNLIGRPGRINVDISRCPPVIRRDYTSWPVVRVTTVIPLTDAELRCIRDHRSHLEKIVNDRGGGIYQLLLDRCASR